MTTRRLDGANPTEMEMAKDVTSPLPSAPHGQVSVLYTINDVLIERCQSIPNKPIIAYPASSHSSDDYRSYTARDLDRFANAAMADIIRQGFKPTSTGITKNKTVALLGASDLDYVVSLFALTRLGCTVLFLSTRLNTEAYVNLLEKTDCHDILYSKSTKNTFGWIKENYAVTGFIIPKGYIYLKSTKGSKLALTGTYEAGQQTAFIVHSSGSTGLPKPIFQTHQSCISNYSVSNAYRAILTLPLYHNHGLSTFFRAVFKGMLVAFFNADLPLTGGNLLRAMDIVHPESFHGVPYALKLLSEVDGGVEALANCKQVLFGGSSCPDDIGDKLVAGGVHLISHYGATEMGQLMTSDRPRDDKTWNYVRPLPNVAPYLHFDPLEDGSYECVVLDGLPSKIMSNCDNPTNSYRTRDCFIKHPTIPNAWKYVTRLDDRITLVNGEKVLPIPIEHRIRQNKLVKEVIVFGVGKALPGLLIIPNDAATGLEKRQILEDIWPDVEAANKAAEAFSQISKEMVEVLDVGTSYPSTDKGTIIRHACFRHFADLIESVYRRFDSGEPETCGTRKVSLGIAALEQFLLSLVQNDLGFQNITMDTDFFDAGMDSLQAIKARSIVRREIDLGKSELGQNLFFDFANVKKLARHLFALRTGEQADEKDDLAIMPELIERYSDFERPKQIENEVVLVTGVTGSLGAHVLSELLQKNSVQRIYCLVRASSNDNALDRVISSLTSRSLALVHISKIRAFPSDLSQKNLGLETHIINDLRTSLTKIVHIAWAVNFNIGVRSFEHQHIRGVHNLINLCLSKKGPAPAQFFFCSSISTAAGTPLPAVIAEGPVPELSHAQNMGYARSKLVAERIVQAAAEKTGMVAKTLRIGQIVGETVTGYWNPTEAIPLMIRSSVTINALPALDETPSWTPVDIVAQAVLDLCALNNDDNAKDSSPITRFSEDPITIYHVQNSKTFHWTHDLLPALRDAGLDFETVSQREWVRRLREGNQDPIQNPTIKLLDFFTGKYDNDNIQRKNLVFEMTKTAQASPVLRHGVELIKSGLITKYVDRWLEHW